MAVQPPITSFEAQWRETRARMLTEATLEQEVQWLRVEVARLNDDLNTAFGQFALSLRELSNELRARRR